jgi:hypothetical protein
MPEINPVEAKLVVCFGEKQVKAALEHFAKAMDAFQRENWELCIAGGGKFIEAVSKALSLHVGIPLPPARRFSVGTTLNQIEKLPIGTFNDAIRITIPRACSFAYDIASNRGARHDPEEVNPNEGDATIMVAIISWILAELLRYSQKGIVDQSELKELIEGIIQRRFPAIETVDGRTYFHIPGLSARQVGLLALWHQHPMRMSPDELKLAMKRHRFSDDNVKISLSRILNVVDVDAKGKYRLLAPGLDEAEQIMRGR